MVAWNWSQYSLRGGLSYSRGAIEASHDSKTDLSVIHIISSRAPFPFILSSQCCRTQRGIKIQSKSYDLDCTFGIYICPRADVCGLGAFRWCSFSAHNERNPILGNCIEGGAILKTLAVDSGSYRETVSDTELLCDDCSQHCASLRIS